MRLEIEFPLPVEPVLKQLEDSGHRAYLAGACVRDWLLGRVPEIWEILSSALPGEIAGLFAGAGMGKFSISAQGGAVGLKNRHYSCEIVSLSGGRPEGECDFMRCLAEELGGRDFTVNAMAYSLKDGFVDPFLGRADLENGTICCVGDPNRYFAGNGQAILRAVRTAALLGFQPDARLLRAAIEHRETLAAVPADYVGCELLQIFSGCGHGLAGLVRQTQELLLTILPELIPMVGFQQNNRYHVHDVWQHTLAALEAAGCDEIVRFAVLFHDIGKPYCYTEDGDGTGHFYGHGAVSANITDQVLGRLGFDVEIRAKITELVKYHDVDFKESHRSMRRWLNRLGPEQMRRLLEVRRCDICGQNPQLIRERTEKISRFASILEDVAAEDTHFRVRDLAVSGADLIKIGYTPGRGLGEALRRLAAMVEDGRLHNERASLLEEASRQLVIDTNICYDMIKIIQEQMFESQEELRMNDNLTPKQSEVYDYVKAAMREKGYCPTVREICLAVGLTSTSSVHAHLNTLERKGYIRRNPLKPRTIELVESAADQESDLLRIPIVGTVAAGLPLLADQNIDDYVSFPAGALHHGCGGSVFMLRVKGDSMINAGIYHGDKIIVEQCDTAENGDIVVALVEDSATVKRFFKENGHYRLQPENDAMQPIIVDQVEIQGKVIGLLRSF